MPKVECPIENCPYVTPDLGDAIVAALITAHCTTHPVKATAPAIAIEKLKRPTIETGGSTEDWNYFLTRWNDYVDGTKLTGKTKVIQLLECCDESLRKSLTRSAGGSLVDKTTDEVLAAIKTLAIKDENVMLSRISLHNMSQNHGENVRSFGSRIQGQASICKFQLKCPNCDNNVDYTDSVLRDVLIKGIDDQDIQSDILGSTDQDMSLDKVFKFIETKESAKSTASKLNSKHSTSATSTYKKSLTSKPTKDRKIDTTLCEYCGKAGHGQKAHYSLRKNKCPAFDHLCKKCDRKNHFESVCKQKITNEIVHPSSNDEDSDSIILDMDHTIQFESASNELNFANNLEHHKFDKTSNSWLKKSPEPQPYITLKITTSHQDYNHFGYKLNSKTASAFLPVMADTGCQSNLAGIEIMAKLKLKSSDLIPVRTKMHAANKKPINILGAAILRFTGHTNSGDEVESRQITYITDSTDKIFLSKEACIDFGMIP